MFFKFPLNCQYDRVLKVLIGPEIKVFAACLEVYALFHSLFLSRYQLCYYYEFVRIIISYIIIIVINNNRVIIKNHYCQSKSIH